MIYSTLYIESLSLLGLIHIEKVRIMSSKIFHSLLVRTSGCRIFSIIFTARLTVVPNYSSHSSIPNNLRGAHAASLSRTIEKYSRNMIDLGAME